VAIHEVQASHRAGRGLRNEGPNGTRRNLDLPVCSSELFVTRLQCRGCGTAIEGDFSVGRFGRLSREQLALLESFLRARGNLKELERELKLSYRRSAPGSTLSFGRSAWRTAPSPTTAPTTVWGGMR